MKRCPMCGTTYEDAANFCDNDRAPLVPLGGQAMAQQLTPTPTPGPAPTPATKPNVKCTDPKCGWSGPEPDDGFCPQCGLRIGAQVTPAAQGAPTPPPQPVPNLPRAKLVLADSSEIPLDNFPREFGRADVVRVPGADYVGRSHLKFYREDVGGAVSYYVEDNNSLNGTELNGEVIGEGRQGKGRRPLKDGDVIGLSLDEKKAGTIKMTFRVAR